MAAEELARAGIKVLVADAKPSVGRKFLMAGKSGLNLTRDEPFESFVNAYTEAATHLRPMLENFGPEQVKSWARDLDQEVFTGSSGRVFPQKMKASPLLRSWLTRLGGLGVDLRTRWRWTGWLGTAFQFETPNGNVAVTPKLTILALGGASWARLGSDGAWATWLADKGVDLSPFAPANVGVALDWSDHMRRHFGAPLKPIQLTAGATTTRGECVISKHGLEGGGIYAISRAVRDGADLTIDLLPDLTHDQIAQRVAKPRGKNTGSNHLRKTLKLDPARLALLLECAHPLPDMSALPDKLKSLSIRHAGLRPLDEAISTAGGVAWSALDDNLQLKAIPTVYVAGEMLDWEAPTGGYLLTACLATGKHSGQNAARSLLSS